MVVEAVREAAAEAADASKGRKSLPSEVRRAVGAFFWPRPPLFCAGGSLRPNRALGGLFE